MYDVDSGSSETNFDMEVEISSYNEDEEKNLECKSTKTVSIVMHILLCVDYNISEK